MDWRRVWAVARHEYTTNIQRAGFIIMTAIVPGLGILVLLIGTLLRSQTSRLGEALTRQFEIGDKPIGVVDYSGYFGSPMPEYAGDFVPLSSEAEAEQALLEGRVSSVLVIPEDYLETGEVVALSTGSFTSAALSDSTRVRAFMVDHLLAGRVEPALRLRATDPLLVRPRIVSGSGQAPAEGGWGFAFTFIIPYFLSIFLVMTIFFSSGYLLQSVAEEKESRVIEIVVSSVRTTELMVGKVLGLGALGLTQVLVWLGSAAGFGSGAVVLLAASAGAAIPVRVLALGAIYYVLGYLLYGFLMAGVGALGTTMRESQQLAGIFSFFAAIPYMMSGFLFTMPNAALPRVLSYIPLTAPTMMMMRVPLGEVPLVDIIGSIVVLLLSLPVALWVGTRLFRVGLLIYGKRPTLREVWFIVRRG
jgi:ABC-2 type transport system permease protein